jgi:hypothetical protein
MHTVFPSVVVIFGIRGTKGGPPSLPSPKSSPDLGEGAARPVQKMDKPWNITVMFSLSLLNTKNLKNCENPLNQI